MYQGQIGWKPKGFRFLGPAGRAKVRENKNKLKARALKARQEKLGLSTKNTTGATPIVEVLPVTQAELNDIKSSIEPIEPKEASSETT